MDPGNRRRKEKDNTQEIETQLDTVADSGAAGNRSGYCNGADCVDFKSVYSLTGCVQYLPGHRPKCYCSLRAQQHAARCTEFMLIA